LGRGGRALVLGGSGQYLGLRADRRVLLVGEHGLTFGQGVVGEDLANGGFGLVRGRLIDVMASARLVLGLAAGRLVAVSPAG